MFFRNLLWMFPVAILLMSSCTESPPPLSKKSRQPKELFMAYSNQKDLKNYFKATFNEEIDLKTDTIFFIPLNSCDKCVDALMTTISKNKFNGWIVFGGDIKQTPIFKDKYNLLNENFNCLIDKEYTMYRYNLKIAETTLLVSNKAFPINYGNIKDMCSVLHWKK